MSKIKKIVLKYGLEFIFISFILILSVRLLNHYQDIFNWFDNEPFWSFFDGIVTIGTLIAVLVNLYRDKRKEKISLEKISIYFQIKEDNTKYRLNLALPRKDITRAEIQGILSNFLKDSTKRYNIDYTSDLEYLESIYDVQNNKKNELILYLSNKELIQGADEKKDMYSPFDLSKMEKVNEIHKNNN